MTLAFEGHVTSWSRFAIVSDNFLVNNDTSNLDGFSSGLVLVRFFSATAPVMTLFIAISASHVFCKAIFFWLGLAVTACIPTR